MELPAYETTHMPNCPHVELPTWGTINTGDISFVGRLDMGFTPMRFSTFHQWNFLSVKLPKCVDTPLKWTPVCVSSPLVRLCELLTYVDSLPAWTLCLRGLPACVDSPPVWTPRLCELPALVDSQPVSTPHLSRLSSCVNSTHVELSTWGMRQIRNSSSGALAPTCREQLYPV